MFLYNALNVYENIFNSGIVTFSTRIVIQPENLSFISLGLS